MFLEILSIPLILIFIYFFWPKNILLSILFGLVILGLLSKKYNQRELMLVLIGLVAGAAIELIAVRIGFESYHKPTFGGIPLWLPLMWAYASLIIWRVGKFIILK